MFITDKLVYIQLQKTGCSQIANLLQQTVGGEQRGRHNAATKDLLNSSRQFVCSIRNPWEWYVSLWSYGCDGKGGFRKSVTERNPRALIHAHNPISLGRLIHRELVKKTKRWARCYEHPGDPASFREWLRMLYNPEFRFDFGEGYGESTVHGLAGLYTYRYLRLCCRNTGVIHKRRFRSDNDLENFDNDNCYISKWIRNESLESDFIEAVSCCGEELSSSDTRMIYTRKRANVSSRSQPTGFYYDDETADLVRRREALIVRKFGYSL